MTQTTEKPTSAPEERRGRTVALTLGAAAVLLIILWAGLSFLKMDEGPAWLLSRLYRAIGLGGQADAIDQLGLNPTASKLVIAMVALILGTLGVWALFIIANKLIELLPGEGATRLRPYVFIAPAVALLGFYLVFPLVGTIIRSFTEDGGFVDNYKFVFTDPAMRIAFRNNIAWLLIGTTGAVLIGLGFAALVDRVKHEALAKVFIFIPMAISMVGATVIWRFVYYWRPPGEPQIGLFNAVLVAAGREPVAFMQTAPLNTLLLIVIMIWLMTGFAMVILSAAIKGVPDELIEAARLDGATERQIFFRVIVPSIKGALITVTTTVFIAILKVFDIVFVMTGGRFQTEVIANRMFSEMFKFRNFGRASALAVVLLIVVIPIMVVNVRNLRTQGVGA
jgi:alpha-glucoside transport system permease protein